MSEQSVASGYAARRQELVEINRNFIGVVLREKEKRLDDRLKALVADCADVCGGKIPCDQPVIANPRLWRTPLYAFCKALPKGADLHVHGSAQLPAWKMIRFLSTRTDVVIDPATMILHSPDSAPKGSLPVGEALEEGIIDRAALERTWTVLGASESEDIWEYFERLFGYHEVIDNDKALLLDYSCYSFEESIKCGIYHMELHVLLSADKEETFSMVRTIREAYYRTKAKYPFFCLRIIGASMKMFSYDLAETEAIFHNALLAQQELKDESDPANPKNFVVGFDLINEEDTSRALKDYAPLLMEHRQKHPDFHYFLHCGESLNSENDNLIDAYLLGSIRVGHGMNLYRYPDLLRRYVKDEVCLEVCPISNQVLRYTLDLRLHPGAEYLKRGVTLALCSDDTIYQEHEQLTDDFFLATVAWGLGVAEIKQLCINSIQYASLDEETKRGLLRHWYEEWNRFIDETLNITEDQT